MMSFLIFGKINDSSLNRVFFNFLPTFFTATPQNPFLRLQEKNPKNHASLRFFQIFLQNRF